MEFIYPRELEIKETTEIAVSCHTWIVIFTFTVQILLLGFTTNGMTLFIFWIIFLLDLELNFIDNLLVFRWELIVLLLLQICFFFVMRDIS